MNKTLEEFKQEASTELNDLMDEIQEKKRELERLIGKYGGLLKETEENLTETHCDMCKEDFFTFQMEIGESLCKKCYMETNLIK